jgi:hypothetical protein
MPPPTSLWLVNDRPAIVSIQEHEDGDEIRVKIALTWLDGEFSGEASGPAEWSYRPRLVGEATLRAVEAVTNHAVHLSLAAVATTPLGSAQVAMAQVMMEGESEPLVGTALLGHNDEAGATVKAVLDAINRRLSKVL